MVKVLMFGWEFPPLKSGGLGTACRGLTKSLSHQDVDIIFVLPKKMPIEDHHMKFVYGDNAHISKTYFINSMLHGYVTSKSYGEAFEDEDEKNFYASSLAEEVERYGEIGKKIAQQENFDIIHAHDWLTTQAAVAAKAVSGKKLILHVHATEFDRSGGGKGNRHVHAIEKLGMEKADKIIANSALTKKRIVENYGIDAKKVVIVHNGIEFKEFVLDELHELKRDKRIVLSLGRITLQKGIDYFVKTAKKVIEFYPNALFVVAGSGDMEQQIIEMVAQMNLADKFIFTGFLNEEDCHKAYKMADIFIMPSVSEPFGLTPLESMHVGTPALISNQSGVSEVIRHALKTDFWDIDEMTNKIVAVLRHKELHNTLKENGKKEADTQTWNGPAKRIAEIYDEMLEEEI